MSNSAERSPLSIEGTRQYEGAFGELPLVAVSAFAGEDWKASSGWIPADSSGWPTAAERRPISHQTHLKAQTMMIKLMENNELIHEDRSNKAAL